MKARIPKGYGGGASNMQQLARQAQKMQEAMEIANTELEAKEYSATSGGAVNVTVTGKMEVKSIVIEPEVIDPDDAEMLADLIMAATNEALRAASQDKEDTMGALSGGLSMPGLF